MIIVEFFGGPGSGKTSLAASVFAAFKREAIECEFTREYAQELFYKGRQHLLGQGNQFGISAGQYVKYCELKRCGTKILFSDTSLRLCKVYAEGTDLNRALWKVIDEAEKEFNFIRVFVNRVKPYRANGRLQSEAESKRIDTSVKMVCGPFDFTVDGSDEGFCELYTALKERLDIQA